MSKGWDSATLKKLKSLMGKGLSTSEIGKRLGMSKNAVVGKLYRLERNNKSGADKVASKTAPKKSAAKPVAKKPVAPAKTAKKPTKSAVRTTNKKAAVKPVKKSPAPKKEKATSKSGTKKSSNLKQSLAMHQRIIQHSLEMANLKTNQCRWPIGDPDSENFHFCGEPVFVGKPYCYEHCKQAYQFTPPKKK